MSSILDLEVFVRTADTGSLSAAARSLGLSPAAASIALKRLETRLGSRLLARSTRSMRLTEEGRRYLDSVGQAEEVAAGYVLAMENSFMTGAVIDIDGGGLL